MSPQTTLRSLTFFMLMILFSTLSTGVELSFLQKLYKSPVESPEWLAYSKQFAASTTAPLETQWLYDVRRIKLLSDDPYEVLRDDFYDQSKYLMRYNSISQPRRKYIFNYYSNGDYSKAIQHLQQEEVENPDNLYVLMNMAHVYEKMNQIQPALERISEVLEKSFERSTRVEIYKWRIRLYGKLKDFASAEVDLIQLRKLLENQVDADYRYFNSEEDSTKKLVAANRLLQSQQELAETKNFLGINWFFQNKLVLAFDLFESLEAEFPGCYSFSFNKNKIYLEKRRYESTLKAINAILGNTRSLASYYKRLTLKSINSGDLDRAQQFTESREYFEKLVSRLLTRKGEILFREKHNLRALKIFELALERNSKDAVSWYRSGLIYTQEKNFDKALIGFRKVLQHTSEDSRMHQNSLDWIDKIFSEQAVQAIKTQEYQSKKRDEFLQNLDVDQRQEIKDLSELIRIGYTWLRDGQQHKLIKFYEPLLSDYPNVMEIYYLLGKAYQALGLIDQARKHFKRSLNIDSNHLPSLVALIYFDCIAKDFEQAKRRIKILEERYPEDHRVIGSRGWYEYQKGNYEMAIDAFQRAIQKNPLHAEHHYRLGMAYLQTDLAPFALHKFDDSISAGFEYARAHLFRAISMLKLGDFVGGENALKLASARGADNPRIVGFARYLLSKVRKGRQLTLSDKEVPEELRNVIKYLERFESKKQMEISLAEIRQGNTQAVIKMIDNRIKEDSDNLELYHLLAVLYMLIDREDMAQEILEDSISRNPMHYPSLNSVAELAFRQGRIDQSVIYWERMKHVSPLINYSPTVAALISQMKQYLDVNPQDYWALNHCVLLYVHLNQDEEALRTLEKYPVLAGNNSDHIRSLQRLNGMLLYRKGILNKNEELIKQSEALLKISGYRYLDNLEIYKIGTEALRPIVSETWQKTPVSPNSLDFLRSDLSRQKVLSGKESSHPGVRKNPTFLSRWNQLDEVLKKGNTTPIKSSYDSFVDKRVSEEERYLEDSRQRAQRLSQSNRELQVVNEQKAQIQFNQALESLSRGDFEKVEAQLLEAISAKVDFEEAYFGLLTTYLVMGDYAKMKPFMKLLETFQNSKELLSLIKIHLNFHQGNLAMVKAQISSLSWPLKLPKNRIVNELIKIYQTVVSKAPGDLQSALRYGLLLQITGRFREAEKVYIQVGDYKGLIPFICESLTTQAILERRFSPMREAVNRMSDFATVESKEKWLNLAKDMDSYLLGTRFLAQ